jgi:hypothetical protein
LVLRATRDEDEHPRLAVNPLTADKEVNFSVQNEEALVLCVTFL